MNDEILKRFEVAIECRNPLLIKSLRPGITAEKIKKKLDRAGITGAIEPIVWFYSWRSICREVFYLKLGFFPRQFYMPVDLSMAIADMIGFKEIADAHPENPRLAEAVGCYFPLFLGGRSEAIYIAVDISPGKQNRIMINDLSDSTFREAYPSFNEFVEDIIRANNEDVGLRCFGATT
jgi:hypothetical protein